MGGDDAFVSHNRTKLVVTLVFKSNHIYFLTRNSFLASKSVHLYKQKMNVKRMCLFWRLQGLPS